MTTVANPKMDSLSSFIGQEKICSQLRVWIDRVLIDRLEGHPSVMPHVLITSLPGMGKTTLADVIVGELGLAKSTLFLDLSRMDNKRLQTILMGFRGGAIIIDEAHRASRAQQDMLLEALLQNKLPLSYGGFLILPPFTAIVMTTHPEKLEPAFIDRCVIQLNLDETPYTPDELAQMIDQMAAAVEMEVPGPDLEGLAKASLGSPRRARDLTTAYWTLRPASSLEGALALLNREHDGLTWQHLRYMEVLRDVGGSLGETKLATLLRMHPITLKDIDRTLVDRGMVIYAPMRVLTAAGLDRLSQGGES
jgi:Holliday junction DNA helicase RuvB